MMDAARPLPMPRDLGSRDSESHEYPELDGQVPVVVPPAPADPISTLAAQRSRTASESSPHRFPVDVPSSTGKLLFTRGGDPYMCSASTVNSASKALIITAAHCIYDYDQWSSNFVYIPQYESGSAPLGVWNWSSAVVLSPWVDDRDFMFDFGAIRLNTNNSQNIGEATGANGFATGFDPYQLDIRIWGWPGNILGGLVGQFCQGDALASGAQSVLYCGMGGGSSGGPWWLYGYSDDADALGIAYAIQSRSNGTHSLAFPLNSYLHALIAHLG